jgi:hypothetical protein
MEIAGHKINNWVIIGGAGGLILVIYLYKRGSSGSSAAASSSGTDSSGVDPTTGLPYSEDDTVDPLTGMTYLQEAQEYGSVSAAETAYASGSLGSSLYSDSGYSGTAGYSTSNVGTTTGTTSTSYATNAAWSQAVTAGLTELGYSSTDISTALGLFFSQQPLPTLSDGVSAASIVQAAEAEYGPPPQGTYEIIPSSSTGTTTGTGTTTATKSAGSISNLQPYSVTKTSFTARWNPDLNNTGGYKYVLSQLNGVAVKSGTTSGTSVSFTGLHSGYTYNFAVQGLPGGAGDNIHVTLPKN